jgi:polygalacturonase
VSVSCQCVAKKNRTHILNHVPTAKMITFRVFMFVFQVVDFDFGGAGGDMPGRPYKVSIINDLYEEQQQRPIETIVTSRTARPVAPINPAKVVSAAAAATAAAKTVVSAAAVAAAKTGVRPAGTSITKTVVMQKPVCDCL